MGFRSPLRMPCHSVPVAVPLKYNQFGVQITIALLCTKELSFWMIIVTPACDLFVHTGVRLVETIQNHSVFEAQHAGVYIVGPGKFPLKITATHDLPTYEKLYLVSSVPWRFVRFATYCFRCVFLSPPEQMTKRFPMTLIKIRANLLCYRIVTYKNVNNILQWPILWLYRVRNKPLVFRM